MQFLNNKNTCIKTGTNERQRRRDCKLTAMAHHPSPVHGKRGAYGGRGEVVSKGRLEREKERERKREKREEKKRIKGIAQTITGENCQK